MTPSSPQGRPDFATALAPLSRATVDPIEATDLILSLLLLHREIRAGAAWESVAQTIAQAASAPGDLTPTQALDVLAVQELTSEFRVLDEVLDWPAGSAPLSGVDLAEDFPLHLMAPVLEAFPGPGRSWHRTLADTAVEVMLRGEATLLSHGSRSSVTSRILTRAAAGSVHHHAVVYDPACGTGEVLWALSTDAAAPEFIGNDLDPDILRIAHLRAALRGVRLSSSTQDIVRDLSTPQVKADVVVCEAGRMILDGHEEVHEDETPARSIALHGQAAAGLKVLRHAAAALSPHGRAYVIVPQVILDAQVHYPARQNREWLVQSGALESLVQLGGSVASYTEEELLLCVLRAPGDGAEETPVQLIDASQEDEIVEQIGPWMDSLRAGQRPLGVRAGTVDRRRLIRGGILHRPATMLPAYLRPDDAHEGLLLGRMSLQDAMAAVRKSMTAATARAKVAVGAQTMVSLQSLIDSGAVTEVRAGHDEQAAVSATEDGKTQRVRLLRPLVRLDQSPVVTVPADMDLVQDGDLVFAPEDTGVVRPAPAGGARWVVRPQDRVLRVDPTRLSQDFLLFCLRQPWDETSRAQVGGISRGPTTGSTRRQSPLRPWSDYSIPLLPLAEQRELIAALRALDDLAVAADDLAQQARQQKTRLAQHLRFRHDLDQAQDL